MPDAPNAFPIVNHGLFDAWLASGPSPLFESDPLPLT
jgi:hypothetical protein